MRCPACQTEIAPGATFCAVCRTRGQAPLARPVLPPAPAPQPTAPTADDDRHERMFLILACLFAVGPLAVPRLMRSRAFGPTGKAVLAFFAIGQFVLVVAILGFLVFKGPQLVSKYMQFLQRGY